MSNIPIQIKFKTVYELFRRTVNFFIFLAYFYFFVDYFILCNTGASFLSCHFKRR
jgi:hypothetical protein